MRKTLLALCLSLMPAALFGATGTTYIPQGLGIDASKVQGDGHGVIGTSMSGTTTTNIDLSITDDEVITGLELITSGAALGDYLVLQVVVAGNVIGTPIPGPWYVPMSGDSQFDLIIPVKIPGGITLRAVYHGTGGILSTPSIAINYKLWKVLI